ncbi:SMI1/KNR4 family protein [Streptomyces amakusaensis]|uniref:SMI1/KNR4 family protein n=1 Tax=Streptomyces amakusaensis TaxID=67271 RepID=A0ABW0AH83_9ACTN
MEAEQLLRAVSPLVWPDSVELVCPEPGHRAGHTCLTVPEGTNVADVPEVLDNWYGSPLTEEGGLPAELPCGEEARWTHVWPFAGRWIAFGRRRGEDARPLLAVARRPAPSPDGLPPDASWLDRLVAVTGWSPSGAPGEVDWAAVEARLGTRLPNDYKRLHETFGEGLFDGYFNVYSPRDVIRHADFAVRAGQESWEPYPPFPAPGGVLHWAGTEDHHAFAWVTEGPDPDRWGLYATYEGIEEGIRFECTVTEFLFHQLTDPHHPFGVPAAFGAHWFHDHNGLKEDG